MFEHGVSTMLVFMRVQLWSAKDSKSVDRAFLACHSGTVSHLVDAEDVSLIHAGQVERSIPTYWRTPLPLFYATAQKIC